MSDDDWGCVIGGLAVLAGGWWLWNNYEVRKRDEGPTLIASALPTTPAPIRPAGMIELTEGKNGWVYRLNADSVRGDRKHRQGWVIIDASKDKSVPWRFQHILTVVDCDTTALREISFLAYDAKGESVWPGRSNDPVKTDPEFYPEGTIGYAPVRGMCGPEFDQPKAS